jgi:NAD(P)H-hydrate epimerase
MKPLLTAAEMRALESWAIREWGIPSLVLQEHAAIGALALIPSGAPINVLAGPGNNGGDAFALARLAKLQGRQVDVWVLDQVPKWNGDAALQAKLWEGIGGRCGCIREPDREIPAWHGWAVDGLFGLGARLPIDDIAASWAHAIEKARSAGAIKVLALDLPTGLDPSSGEVPGPAVRADATACFGHLKRCHGLMPAKELCGKISLIPLPLSASPDSSLLMLSKPRLKKPHWDSHKYELGHIAIRAGTKGMGGAAALAAIGALRGGAGLVTVLPDSDAANSVALQVPEAIVRPWNGELPPKIDVLLVGPGGVADIPEWGGPLVLDASALKDGEGLKWLSRPQTIITPHSGEFSRLFCLGAGKGFQWRLGALEKLPKQSEGVLVLKGAQTLIVGGKSASAFVNPTGHPGLSTGGTGDFLAGLAASRLARNLEDPLAAACEAVWLHGEAADRLGAGPLLARDLGESLAQLLMELYIA